MNEMKNEVTKQRKEPRMVGLWERQSERERAVTKVVIVISGRVRRVKLDFSIQRVAKEILIIFFLIESSGFPASFEYHWDKNTY